MAGTSLSAQTHSLEGPGSSAPSPAPNTPQCSPLASSTFLIPLHKFQLIRFQVLAMKNNKCEGPWGVLGTHFCGLAAQVGAKGNYFLRLGNPCSGRKQIPSPPTTAASTALTKRPLISHPRAKIRLFSPQTFQFNSFFSQTRTICPLTPLLGCGDLLSEGDGWSTELPEPLTSHPAAKTRQILWKAPANG